MEKVLIVCDWCEKPAVTTATVKMNGSSSLSLDLCADHRDEVKATAHKPKRGRRAGVYAG